MARGLNGVNAFYHNLIQIVTPNGFYDNFLEYIDPHSKPWENDIHCSALKREKTFLGFRDEVRGAFYETGVEIELLLHHSKKGDMVQLAKLLLPAVDKLRVKGFTYYDLSGSHSPTLRHEKEVSGLVALTA